MSKMSNGLEWNNKMDMEDFERNNENYYAEMYQSSEEASNCPDLFDDWMQQDEQKEKIVEDMCDCYRERLEGCL